MRAIRVTEFGQPEVLKIDNAVPVPQPSSKQVLIQVKSAGVNPIETYRRSGDPKRTDLPSLPWTPGSDAAGIVVKVGSDVTSVKAGDRVYTLRSLTGSYAEYTTVAENRVHPLSDRLTFQQGAAIGVPYFTAYRALHQKAKAKSGEKVLIHGASGAVGVGCIQFAKANGMQVYGTAGSDAGCTLVKQLGADYVFNHNERGYTTELMDATGGHGFDVIIEMLANINLQRDLEMLNRFGRIVIVGCRGKIEIDPKLTMIKETAILGLLLSQFSEEEYGEIVTAVYDGMTAGYIEPYVGREYPLHDSATAHRDIMDREIATIGRLAIVM